MDRHYELLALRYRCASSTRRRLVTEQVLGLTSPVSRRGKLPSLQLICAVPCCRHRVPLHTRLSRRGSISIPAVLRRALPTFKPTRAATLPPHSAALCPPSSRNPAVLTLLTPCALRELMLTRVTPLHRSPRFGTPSLSSFSRQVVLQSARFQGT